MSFVFTSFLPLVDDVYDQHVYSDGKQAVVWAIGQLNDRQEVSYHSLVSKGDIFIDFARTPQWNCPNSEMAKRNEDRKSSLTSSSLQPSSASSFSSSSSSSSSFSSSMSSHSSLAEPIPTTFSASVDKNNRSWTIPPIVCPSDNTFRFQIGPTGGKKGYQSITGKVGWGIAWYVNGLIIPELTVERGKTYTFIVEGGNDKIHSSKRHPLYITDSHEGGFEHKSDDERRSERVFAGIGITRRGDLVPTAEGRLCEWKIDTRQTKKPEDFDDFFQFQRTLSLQCNSGEPGVLHWKPDKNTPDTVYYQCYSHRLFGWKIRVVDSCDHLASASYVRYSKVPANSTLESFRDNQSLEINKKKNLIKPQNGVFRKEIWNRGQSQSHFSTNLNSKRKHENGHVKFPDSTTINEYNHQQYQRVRPIEISGMSTNLYPIPMPLPVGYFPLAPIRALDMYLSAPYPQPFLKRAPIYLRPNSPALLTSPFSTSSLYQSVPKSTRLKPLSQQESKLSPNSETIGLNLHGGFVPVLINSKSSEMISSSRVPEAIEIIPLTDSEINMTQFLFPKIKPQSTATPNLGKPNELHYSIRQPGSNIKLNNKDGEKIEYLGYLTEEEDNDDSGGDNADDRNNKDVKKPGNGKGKTVPDQVYHAVLNDGKGAVRFENVFPIVPHSEVEETKIESSDEHILKTPLEMILEDEKDKAVTEIIKDEKNETDLSSIEASHSNVMNAYNKLISNQFNAKEYTDPRSSPDYELSQTDLVDSDSSAIPSIASKNTSDTDDAILAHILSLIADNATPPEVKIITHQNGHIHSTNVEIHHKLSKRSPHNSEHKGHHHHFELVSNQNASLRNHATAFKSLPVLTYFIITLFTKLY